MMEKVLLVLDEESIGRQKRLFQLIRRSNSVHAHYQNTWCELFKTKSYKRRREHQEKIKRAIAILLGDMYPESKSYSVEMLGSKRLSNVQDGKFQRYLVIVTDKEVQ